MIRLARISLKSSLFIILLGCGPWNALAQTTNYSIPAGSGTLTYTETVAPTGTCPVGSPTGPQDPIIQSLFNTFAYNGVSLSGSVAYVNSPGGSYCPSSGWQGPIPVVLTGSNYTVFFTPSLSGAGTASLDAITVSATPTTGVYGTNVTFTATEAYPNASGTVIFYDGSTTLGTSSMTSDVATFPTSALAPGLHSITAAFSGSAPSETSPALSFTVNKATPSASLSCSPNPVTYVPSGTGTLTTCTAMMNAPGSTAGVAFTYNGNAWTTIALSNSTAAASGFSPGTAAQSFSILASYAGDSNYNAASASTTFTVSPASQTISSFTATPTSGSTFSLSASASSGLGVVYSVLSGPGVISGSTLTLNAGATGTIQIAANQAGNSNYTAAAQVTQNISATSNGGSLGTTGLGTVSYQATSATFSCGSPAQTVTQYEFSSFTFTPTGGSAQSLTGNPMYYFTAGGTGCPSAGWQGPSPAIFQGTNLQVYVTGTAGTPPTISTSINTLTLTPPYSGTMVYGSSLTFTAKQWNSAAAGSITFYAGTTQLATVALAGGTASFALTTQLAASTTPYSISATYNSSNGYPSVSSPATAETVSKATPAITWAAPAAIIYGTALNATQLDATASVAGTFTYSPVSGTVLAVGSQTLAVTFTPTDTTDYTTATKTATLTVNKATPAITWTTPAAITYGTALSATQLDATTGVAGTLTYSPVSGTVLAAGSQSLSVTFTPTNTTDYNTATGTVTLTVNKATPTITWATPAAITYGTALSTTQLDATASVAGTLTYSPVSGTVLALGSQTLAVTFTPTNTTDYNTATGTVTLTVNKATPAITWTTPAAITYGTALSATQLDATSGIAGTFTYSPVSGSVLTAGSRPLSVTFTPTNTTDYNTATGTVTLTVNKATPIITWATPAAVPDGTTLSSVQLNATSNVPGTLSYSPSVGTVMTAGTQALSVTFTPTDTTDYTSASGSVSLTVSFAPGAGIITTDAGSGPYGYDTGTYSGNNGPAINATLSMPESVALDTAGNIYFVDFSNNVIRKVTASTGAITTVAGTGSVGSQGDNGPALSANLNFPSAVAVDTAGNIYIADTGNNRIRKVAASTGYITTVAGNGSSYFYSGTGGPATSAVIAGPSGVAVDAAGNIFIASGCLVLEVAASTTDLSIVAGSLTTATVPGGGTVTYGACGNTGDLGLATSADVQPFGIAVDSSDNVYIGGSGNAIRKVTASTGIITRVAGNYSAGYSGDDGLATNAQLNSPFDVAVDAAGDIYIADVGNNVISKVFPDNGFIVTIAGNTTAGFSGDGGLATSAELDYPLGVAVGANENVYIGDSENNRIRVVGYNKTAPVISWPSPSQIIYGTSLSSTQLNATTPIAGTFTYTPAAGTVLTAGTQALSATFVPTDTTDFATVTVSVPLTVNKATPVITWATPAAIAYGTQLSGSQLDAAATGVTGATLPGNFVYVPNAPTVLSAGPHTLTGTFTPTDTTDYYTAVAEVTEIVSPESGTADQGTVTLTVNSSPVATATVSYNATSTPSSIAEAIAAALVSNSQVTVTSVDDAIYIEATPAKPTILTNYSYTLQAVSSAGFSPPSFLGAYPPNWTISGNLEGGALTGADKGVTVYSYTVPTGGYDGVGNLRNYTDSVTGTWNPSNGYDTLNRLVSTQNTAASSLAPQFAGNYGCWSYDAFGNRLSETISTTSCTGSLTPTSWATYNANNQFTGTNQSPGGVPYDPAGNMLNDGVNQYLYDGDGRICAVASSPVAGMTVMTGYLYDAGGTRIAKGTISTWSCDPTLSGFQATNDYVLGPGGEQVTEMGMGTTGGSSVMGWQHTNVYAGGMLLATYDNDNLHFYLNDPLGTRRVQTDYAGVVEQNCASLPFGDGESCLPTPTENLFTGKERDSESGNDYFEARYYASSMGRFLSPDWSAQEEPVPYAQLDDPQSLNLYSYVRNNPLSETDPDGHCCEELIGIATDAIEDFALSHPEVVDAVAGPLVESASANAAEGVAGSVIGGSVARLALGPLGGVVGAMIFPKDLDNSDLPAEPQAASGGAMRGSGRGGQNDDTIAGQDAHRDFSAKAKAKGWQVEPRLIDPKTGKTVKPDAVTKTGKPVELKPNTASGRAKGRSQLKKYERATGKKGRVIYHGKPKQPNQ